MWKKEEEKFVMSDKAVEEIADFVVRLSRYSYWNKELWRKRVKAHKDDDKAEVQNAYLVKMLYGYGIYCTPCGCAFVNVWKGDDAKETAKEFLERYEDIFADYVEWQYEQR